MGSDGKESMQEAYHCSKNAVTSTTAEEAQAAYSRRAEIYDEQLVKLGFEMQREAALVCLKHIENAKASSVLDLGAGTGSVAFHLRKTGCFNGAIDIMDANMEMLCVASKKELDLRCIICHWIDEDIPLPENSYDAVTCIGSLFPNHLPIRSIKGMLKLVKHEGFLIFNLRNRHAGDDIYISELQDMLDELIRDKVLELVEVKELRHFVNVDDVLTQLYIYRKL